MPSRKVDATIVTYRSTPELMNAVATGEVQAGFEAPAPMLPQLPTGRIRTLAIPSPERFPGLPNVPTTAEAGMPAPIVEKLNREMVRVAALPEIRTRLLELGVETASGTPDALRQLMTEEIDRYNRIVTNARIERL